MNTGFWAAVFGWLFGQEDKDFEDIKDAEESRCECCNRRISREEYKQHGSYADIVEVRPQNAAFLHRQASQGCSVRLK